MKIPLILLASVGLVWTHTTTTSPYSNDTSKEEFTIYLTPWESKVIQVKDLEESDKTNLNEWDKINPLPFQSNPTTTTTNAPTNAPTTTTTTIVPTKTTKTPTNAPTTTTNAPTTTTNAPAKITNTPTNPPTTNSPVTESSISIDLTQRLFFANSYDSLFGWKTLDLSGLDLTGDDVARILHGLNASALASVVRLDLSRNRVAGLPPRVWPRELEYNLRELRLNHNTMYLDDPMNRRATGFELQRLISLKKLSLAHCDLTSELTLEFPRWLESLDLSRNRLFDPPGSLSALTNLQHLDLSGNRIRYLGKHPLASLASLRTLNLSNNGLERTGDDPLEELGSLETLHLNNNSLSEPPKLWHFTGSYQPRMEVYMAHNPFRCECEFQNFVDIGRVHIMDNINVTCVDERGVAWSLGAAPRRECSAAWLDVRRRWSGAKEWLRDNHPDWSTLYRSLGWVLFGVTLGVVYAHRRAKQTPAQSRDQVPYNILDDSANC